MHVILIHGCNYHFISISALSTSNASGGPLFHSFSFKINSLKAHNIPKKVKKPTILQCTFSSLVDKIYDLEKGENYEFHNICKVDQYSLKSQLLNYEQ